VLTSGRMLDLRGGTAPTCFRAARYRWFLTKTNSPGVSRAAYTGIGRKTAIPRRFVHFTWSREPVGNELPAECSASNAILRSGQGILGTQHE